MKIKKSKISGLDVIRILIFTYVAVILIGDFTPFYEGNDSHLYAEWGKRLANGSFEYSNELLETGSPEFIPMAHVKTIHNTVIPAGFYGIYVVSAISYWVGGNYGLFYVGPIFTIILIFVSERIATRLFGDIAGIITLVLVSTDNAIIRFGEQLLTDSISATLIILGSFYFIKFLRERKYHHILFSSCFFVGSTFFRLNGLVYFPIEIILLIAFFVYDHFYYSKNGINLFKQKKLIFEKINKKKFIKLSSYIILPWIVFFLIFFILNSFYFGDPLSTYKDVQISTSDVTSSKFSFFSFDRERFEWIKFYSVGFLPDYFIFAILENANIDFDDSFNATWLSFFSFTILGLALIISLLIRTKRKEILVIITIVVSLLIFYSAEFMHPFCTTLSECQPTSFVRDRFSIPGLILSFMLVGFIFDSVYKINLKQIFIFNSKIFSKVFRLSILFIIIFFLSSSVFSSTQFEKIIKSSFILKNPQEYAIRYPIDSEGLTNKSVIIGENKNYLDYESIPFFPYVGVREILEYDQNIEILPKEPIKVLKKIMNEGYDVFIFKEQSSLDNWYLRYLETSEGIIAKDYSETFCKLELINNLDNLNESSDILCHGLQVSITIDGKPFVPP